MPRRTDIHTLLIIGSGPIVIGQGCEFDYSGTQACKALREEGFRVVLLNSNPATIMTDPATADRTYIEPITVATLERILINEQQTGHLIHAVLPTLGGQTALNIAVEAADAGLFARYNVQMIGANRDAIHRAEDRTEFKETMIKIGLDVPRSGIAHTLEEAREVAKKIGLPLCIRPAYTLGGFGGGIATTQAQFEDITRRGLAASRVNEVLIEESLVGWKEFELEVMRDRADNVVIICSIENLDPMGVHTGDSITVAPQQTLTDREYQRMRDAAMKCIRAIGVDTGGSNIQFGVDPKTGRQVVIEMNPRVSRSSALASKATGYPIAKIAAKLAVGYTLDELPNDITKKTPASFEPVIDYVVVKMPRFAFEKFPEADETLTTQMKSVGEAMAIGRTFKQALQKCIRSMEIKRAGLGLDQNDKWLASIIPPLPKGGQGGVESTITATLEVSTRGPDESEIPNLNSDITNPQSAIRNPPSDNPRAGAQGAEPPADWEESSASRWPVPREVLEQKLSIPCQGRLHYIRYAFKLGWTVEQVYALTHIDPWFLDNIRELTEFESELIGAAALVQPTTQPSAPKATRDAFIDKFETETGSRAYSIKNLMIRATLLGYSDVQLAQVFGLPVAKFRAWREGLGIYPAYRSVDTCAAEFEAFTPYFYSAHDRRIGQVSNTNTSSADRDSLKFVGSNDPTYRAGYHIAYAWNTSQSDLTSPNSQLAFADDLTPSDKPKVLILGGGPNRIGQGIEFDYCCVHAVQAAREMGYETVMVNSNPETVSTDYDTADMLFFEPLTHDDVLNICKRLSPELGVGRVRRPDDADQQPQISNLKSEIPEPNSLDTGHWALGTLKGLIVQFGGQTPLNLAQGLKNAGAPILGTSPEAIHLAEDREAFAAILRELYLQQPPNGIATDLESALKIARDLTYPILVRPSYVLGGRGMQKCNIEADLRRYMEKALDASDRTVIVDRAHPVLIDKFLDEATEVDVDCVADFGESAGAEDGPARAGTRCVICGVMEHIEEAGIHSGDSSCALPPYSLPPLIVDELKRQTELLARRLKVSGLMNVQFAVKHNAVYVLEVNPRASRTIPFVSKATGIPWAKIATRVMLGDSLDATMAHYLSKSSAWKNDSSAQSPLPGAEQWNLGGSSNPQSAIHNPKLAATGNAQMESGTEHWAQGTPAQPAYWEVPEINHISVKAVVFPFNKFPGVDIVLGPEMRSTGEVMGIDRNFPLAFAKAMQAAGQALPTKGTVVVSVNDNDKPATVMIAQQLAEMGFVLVSTSKTREKLAQHGITAHPVSKTQDATGPYLIDMIAEGNIDLIINTPVHWGSASNEGRIRAAAVRYGVPIITTITGARAAVSAIRALRRAPLGVRALQDYFTE